MGLTISTHTLLGNPFKIKQQPMTLHHLAFTTDGVRYHLIDKWIMSNITDKNEGIIS